MLTRTLALAFGVSKTTELAKEVFGRVTGLTPQPYLKSLFAMGLSAGAGYAYGETWRERLELAAGVAGAAAALHEGQAVLSTAADRNKTIVIERAARGAASSVSGSAPGRRVKPL